MRAGESGSTIAAFLAASVLVLLPWASGLGVWLAVPAGALGLTGSAGALASTPVPVPLAGGDLGPAAARDEDVSPLAGGSVATTRAATATSSATVRPDRNVISLLL